MLPGAMYHLYNHANGFENIFAEHRNYDFFLERLSQHVLPVAQLYAYCLMPNHFHLCCKIRPSAELIPWFRQLKEQQLEEQTGVKVLLADSFGLSEAELVKKVSKSFSNVFNSYTQAFNKLYGRKGSLFMQNLKKAAIVDDTSFCRVVHYIHSNPVHHGFVKEMHQWPYSSYTAFLCESPTKLEREAVLKAYGGVEKFRAYHELI